MALKVTSIGTVFGNLQVVGLPTTATQNVAAIKSTSTLFAYLNTKFSGGSPNSVINYTISAGTSFTLQVSGAGGNPENIAWELIV